MARRPFPRGGIRTRLPVTIYRRSSDEFSPTEIEGLALWLDASSSDLYTTDAGPVVAVASPLDIAGCQLWLDASDPASITASSGEVTAWADKSASALSFTAAGTPVTGSHTLNGRNVIRFDNVADLLSATSATRLGITSSYTVFTVARYTTVQTSMLMSIGRSNSPLSGFTLYYNGGLRTIEKRDAAWGTDMVVSGSIATANVALLATCTRSGTDQRIMRDGVLAGSTAGSTGDIFWNTTSVLIGNTFEGTFLGDIAEIIVYPTALTTAQRASVESYLAAKWSISGVHAPATATSDPVGYWGDKSGNGRHAVQSLAGSRPLVGTLNGRKAVTVNGTRSMTLTGVPTNSTSGTYFFAGRYSGGGSWLTASAGSSYYVDASESGSSSSPASNSGSPSYIVRGVSVAATRAALRTASASATYSLAAMSVNFSGWNSEWRILEFPSFGAYSFVGDAAQVLVYNRVLTTEERQRVERWLSGQWAISLPPQVANADAQNWIDRVYANGGSVSSATAAAVNQFCQDLENAPGGSIRDRFYRLNLFCGGTSGTAVGLNSALVPLFRGPSLGGAQYGGATDTNVGGLFVPANYNETGASGGLAGNGSNKHLNTGFPTNTLSASDRHLAAYPITWPNGGYQYFLGSESAVGASQQQFALGHFDYADKGSFAFGPNAGAGYLSSTTAISSGGMWIGVNTSGSGTIYRNGVANGTLSLTAATPTSSEIFAFAVNRASTPAASNYFNGRIGGYSIGLSMTAPQAAAYYTAMQSFQTALTRNV